MKNILRIVYDMFLGLPHFMAVVAERFKFATHLKENQCKEKNLTYESYVLDVHSKYYVSLQHIYDSHTHT
jgi:hypothetical protein